MKRTVKQHLINLPGWRTRRKIVVFESDDWGAVRITNKQAQDAMIDVGVDIDRCHYMKYDTLESVSDLDALFETLASNRAASGSTPIFTANCLVANPDFDRISQDDYQAYSYELVTETVNRYSEKGNFVKRWLEGKASGLFYMQSHGREHCNVSRWMSALKNGDPITRLAFNHGMYGVSGHILPNKRGSYLAAFDGMDRGFPVDQREIVKSGFQLFEQVMGYTSKTFIAPNYVWSDTIEEAAYEMGVVGLQGSFAQKLPVVYPNAAKIKRHYLGQKNKRDQYYLVRNALFEPSEMPTKDWVDACLAQIKAAFTMRKPAIIATHRVNYVSGLDTGNRERGLHELNRLLKAINSKWPDVVFMHSEQLLSLINDKQLK